MKKSRNDDQSDVANIKREVPTEDEELISNEQSHDDLLSDDFDIHELNDRAVSQSFDTLRQIEKTLRNPKNSMLCSVDRRKGWIKECSKLLAKTPPDIVIACLGATGAGESSLLNALLDEAAVLPTSGCRGCTATVVELRFNGDLLNPTEETPVYKGKVEFMSLKEWLEELKLLLDVCCEEETETVFEHPPNGRGQAEVAAAWEKIDVVYGRGTMESHAGVPKSEAWDKLSKDERIVTLLGDDNDEAKTMWVKEGCVNAKQARLLRTPLSDLLMTAYV